MLDYIQEQQMQQEALKALASTITSVRLILVDKGICTQEELISYDQKAIEVVETIVAQQMVQIEKDLRSQYGDVAFENVIKPILKL